MSIASSIQPARKVPPTESLHDGQRLSGEEFDRIYAQQPEDVWAELIEGVVYMMAPLHEGRHGSPHFDLCTWMGVYRARTPGLIGADNTSLRMDPLNRPQPDLYLRILESHGGRSRRHANGMIEGPPDLIAEIAATSKDRDLGPRLKAYQRNGVREYIIWRTSDSALDWFVLRDSTYQPLTPRPDGLLCSEVFPGLWLDDAALLNGDVARVLNRLHAGLESPEHQAFVATLQERFESLKQS